MRVNVSRKIHQNSIFALTGIFMQYLHAVVFAEHLSRIVSESSKSMRCEPSDPSVPGASYYYSGAF